MCSLSRIGILVNGSPHCIARCVLTQGYRHCVPRSDLSRSDHLALLLDSIISFLATLEKHVIQAVEKSFCGAGVNVYVRLAGISSGNTT